MTLNDTTGTDFGSKLASDSVDHHSAEIFSIAVIVNFVSLPRISSVKSSSIFFPTMAWPKGEWWLQPRDKDPTQIRWDLIGNSLRPHLCPLHGL